MTPERAALEAFLRACRDQGLDGKAMFEAMRQILEEASK
jgi:hypothetical protein